MAGDGIAPGLGVGSEGLGARETTPVVQTVGKDLKDKLTADTYTKVQNKLDNAPEPIKKLWYKFADDLKIVNGNHKGGAFFETRAGGICFDMINDAVETDKHKAHATLFHELGHNLDFLVGGKNRVLFYSNTFKSKKFLHGGGEGFTLYDMLHKEAIEYEQMILKNLQDEAVKKGLGKRSVKMYDVRKYIHKELSSIDIQNNVVSDIWSEVSKNKIKDGVYHSTSYWKDRTALAKEAFAEMTEAGIHNLEGLENIKKYFPKSYELYLEMIGGI